VEKWVIECTTYYQSMTLRDDTVGIGKYAFFACNHLTSITIPDSVTSIGEYAFSSCSYLTSITIPSNTKSIGKEAFCGCTMLASITFEGTRTEWHEIDKGDFWNNNILATKVVCTDGAVALR